MESLFANRVDVYETLNNGGVSKILYRNDPTEDWTELYSAAGIVVVQDSNILSVEPEVMKPLHFKPICDEWISHPCQLNIG